MSQTGNKVYMQMCIRGMAENESEFIENDKTKEPGKLSQQINNIMGRRNKSMSNSCLRAKNGNVLLKKTQILERWTKYI